MSFAAPVIRLITGGIVNASDPDIIQHPAPARWQTLYRRCDVLLGTDGQLRS